MKRKHLALLVLLLVTGLACLLPERVLADYDLKRMQVTAEVNADGSLSMTRKIDYDFDDSANGVYYTQSLGQGQKVSQKRVEIKDLESGKSFHPVLNNQAESGNVYHFSKEGNSYKFKVYHRVEEGKVQVVYRYRISGAVEALDSGMDDRVTSLINAMGLSDRFASAEEFLNALSQIELIRSELAQHDSDLTLTFNRLTQTENSITQIFSSFVFGDEGGTPYLDMSASASSVKMRLTNTRLAFIQSGKEMAYFSDNKLYVTRLEVVEQISIGTSSNGYLDMVTTPTGVGFKWRA